MDLDELIKAVVPLTFLAIWALTSLFNREAKPLPPRGGVAGGPLGPYTPPRPRSPYGADPSAESGQRPPTMRWGEVPGGRPQGAEEIFVIREKPAPQPQKQRQPKPAKAQRNRMKANQGAATQNLDSIKTESMAQDLAANLGKSIKLDALNAGVTSAKASGSSEQGTASPILELLRSPERLREAFILKVILDPPPGMRRSIRP